MKAKAETAIVSGLLKAIKDIPDVKAWRNNTGFFMVKGRPLRFGEKGSADIMGVMAPTGRLFAIECKTPTGALEPHQIAWLAAMRKLGARVAVIRNVDVGVSMLTDWLEEEKSHERDDEGPAQLQNGSEAACR